MRRTGRGGTAALLWTPLAMALAACGGGDGGSAGADGGGRFSPLGTGSPAPAYAAVDMAGDSVRLSDFAGEVVLLNLWATWCHPCLREMPLLAEADQREGVGVVVANQGEELLPIVRYLDEQQLSFRYALRDPGQMLMSIVEAPGLPTTVLFDGDGNALDIHVGELTQAHLDRWLED